MTHNLQTAISLAMSALRRVNDIIDGGNEAEIGDIDEANVQKLLDLSDLAGQVSISAEVLSDEEFHPRTPGTLPG